MLGIERLANAVHLARWIFTEARNESCNLMIPELVTDDPLGDTEFPGQVHEQGFIRHFMPHSLSQDLGGSEKLGGEGPVRTLQVRPGP